MNLLHNRGGLIALLVSVACLTTLGYCQEVAPSHAKAPAEKKDENATSSERLRRDASLNKEAAAEDKSAPVKTKVQLLRLSGNYVDFNEPTAIDPTSLLLGGIPTKSKSFYKLCTFLETLAADASIPWVVFDLSDAQLHFNPAQLDELTRRLKQLKSHDRKLVAWLENASSAQLSVAAACDTVVMADFGGVDFSSMSMETVFFRDAMDLLGIKASIVRAGDFKGAVEPFMNASMSDHLRAHYREMLESMNDTRISAIAKGRGLTVAQLREIQAKRFLLPKEALSRNLIDQLAPYGSMKSTVEKLVDAPVTWIEPTKKEPKDMSFFEVMGAVMAGPKTQSSRIKDPTIVVLHLNGPIQDGKHSVPGTIVDGPMVEQIDKLIADSKVRGVVVRINSPGGSATASESVRQALKRLADTKPTVVSMGEVAASGGYWISCIGVPVYAEPSTLTGSIGVFGLKLSFGSLLKRIGVHVETISLDRSAAAYSVDKPWSEEDALVLQDIVDDVYQRFLKVVSESRGLPVESVQPLAGGRVWSGTQAKQHRLVDELGGVDDCLSMIAKKAKLEDYTVIHRPEPSSGLDLFEIFGESDDEEILMQTMRSDVWQGLRQSGFGLQALEAVVRNASQKQHGVPTIWALQPVELQFK